MDHSLIADLSFLVPLAAHAFDFFVPVIRVIVGIAITTISSDKLEIAVAFRFLGAVGEVTLRTSARIPNRFGRESIRTSEERSEHNSNGDE